MPNLTMAGVASPSVTESSVTRRPLAVVRFGVGLFAVSAITIAVVLALCATVLPAVAGWRSVAIVSGSMEPKIGVGDVLVAEPYQGQALQPGWVVVFHDPGGSGLVSHRLEAVNDDGTLTTWGDANPAPDSTPLRPEAVVGVGRVLVPWVGWPTVWAGRHDTSSLLFATLALLAVLYMARWGMLVRFDPWQGRIDAYAGDEQAGGVTVLHDFAFDPVESERFAALHRAEFAAAEDWLAAELAGPTAVRGRSAPTGFSAHLTATMIPVRRTTEEIEHTHLADAVG